ncbi:peptidase inhibitor family I36 protein [Streptomyces sp. GS7]|uniref:peptidase inhibitor family I36 protein n=1 Tax=Streptomyces sp. GS7 TaxID=2692234 RepID=UPI0013195ED9|nr:peptidase inhibitor family I36 protein [Streptomyces sp. GS7]QHC25990.1 hypothetical protein GR130_36025 [Streptomyces sp. GS7]
MKLRAVALSGVALLAVLPLTAGTASAAAKCDAAKICGWAQPNFGGQVSYSSDVSPGCDSVGEAARSVSNQSEYRVTFYSDSGCYGEHFDLTPDHYSAKTPWPVRSIAIWGG